MNGTCRLSTAGTVTTLNVSGEVDMSQSPVARTVTNSNVYNGAKLTANKSAIQFTNDVQLVGCTVQQCDLDFGYGVKLGIS